MTRVVNGFAPPFPPSTLVLTGMPFQALGPQTKDLGQDRKEEMSGVQEHPARSSWNAKLAPALWQVQTVSPGAQGSQPFTVPGPTLAE